MNSSPRGDRLADCAFPKSQNHSSPSWLDCHYKFSDRYDFALYDCANLLGLVFTSQVLYLAIPMDGVNGQGQWTGPMDGMSRMTASLSTHGKRLPLNT